MKLARPTAGSHASLHPSWKLAPSPNHCYPRASSRGTGLQVGSQRHEPPRVRVRPPAPTPPTPPHRGLFLMRARRPRGEGRPTSRPSRTPEPSGRLTPAALSSRLRSSPTSAHLGAAERCGGGESLEVGRGQGTRRRARRPRLSGPPPSRRPQGGPTRTPGDARSEEEAQPLPLPRRPGPSGSPPVRLCGGLLDYVCPPRAAALAAGWRWGGRTQRRRRGRREERGERR